MRVLIRNVRLTALLFCILWFFGLKYIFHINGVEVIEVGLNYVLYATLTTSLIWHLVFKSRILKESGSAGLYKKVVRIVLIYLAYAFIQLLINPTTSDIDYFIDNYSVVLPSVAISVFLGLFAINSTFRINHIFKLLLYIMFLVVLYSELTGITDGQSSSDLRTEGVFGQANNYGYFLTLLVILSSSDSVGLIKIFKWPWQSYLSLLIGLGLILRTGSYGALIICVMAILYLFGQNFQNLSKRALLSGLVGIILIVSSLGFMITNIDTQRVEAVREAIALKSNTENDISEVSTFGIRYFLLIEGIKAFLKDPVIGRGLSARNIRVPGEIEARPVHNVYIVELMKGGFFGFTFFILIYSHIWKCVKNISNQNWRRLAYVLFSYLIFIDNTLTYASFLSMNSGVIALGVLFILIFKDRNLLKLQAEKNWAYKINLSMR